MKYEIVLTSKFKKELKTIRKQNKRLAKLTEVVNALARGKKLDAKYVDHSLTNSKKFENCRECHIEPDWLLIYKINDKELYLLLVETGSHSDLF